MKTLLTYLLCLLFISCGKSKDVTSIQYTGDYLATATTELSYSKTQPVLINRSTGLLQVRTGTKPGELVFVTGKTFWTVRQSGSQFTFDPVPEPLDSTYRWTGSGQFTQTGVEYVQTWSGNSPEFYQINRVTATRN